MKIIISLRELHVASNTRGIGVYTRELIAALHKYYPQDTVIPTTHDPTSISADIVHFTYFDPYFLTLPKVKKLPTILTIHDLIPRKFGEHFPVGYRGKFNWFLQLQKARSVAHIITDSVSSQRDIVELMKINPDHISVIPLAPNKTEKVPAGLSTKIAREYSLPDKYLLYVGDINWNKNVTGLVEAWSRLEDPRLHLVLVGKVFSDKPDIAEYRKLVKAIDKSGRSEQIILLGFVPSHHLSVIYSRATLYVQPSWYEGFGLPLLEAMKFGCPVASSNRGSLPEVGGEAVAYFDPQKDMVETIGSLLRSPAKREELMSRGLLRVKEFTWAKTAKLTHDIYEQVLASRL